MPDTRLRDSAAVCGEASAMTKQAHEPTHWLTVQEAADARGLTYRRVIQWIRDGLLPTSKPGGERGHHLVRLCDVDTLLASSWQPATRGPLAGKAVSA